MRAERQNNQLELAFGKECRGEAPSGLVEGTEVCVARAGTERPAVFISLNPSNRHVRTRMRGGVGGVESRDSPLSRLRAEHDQQLRGESPPYNLIAVKY